MHTRTSPILLLLLLATSASAASEALRIMPMGDSITAATAPGYRGHLYRMLVDAGLHVDFVGTCSGMPVEPADAQLDPDHEGHGGFTVGPGPSLADGWTGGKGNLYVNIPAWLAPDQAKTRAVDIILLHVGVNDYANIGERDPGYDPVRDFAGRYAGLVDRILACRPRAAIIMSTVMPGGNPAIPAVFPIGPFDRINPQLPAIAERRKGHVFCYDGATLAGTGMRWEPEDWDPGDVVHPNARGQRKFAAFWYAAITETIRRGLPTSPYAAASPESK